MPCSGWGTAAAYAAVAVAAVGALLRYWSVRRRVAAAEAAMGVFSRLVDDELPKAVERVKQGEDVDDVVAHAAPWADGHSSEVARLGAVVMRMVLEAEERASGQPESVQRAFVALGQRMQSAHNGVLTRLRALQEEHERDPAVFGFLLELDHRLSRAARFADNIVVLGRGRPGRQWRQPVSLFEVLRGAMSRITDYQRVKLERVAEVWVEGRQVESLVHLLAELITNACEYSPPTTAVRVVTDRVPNGVCLEIDDAGIGLAADRIHWVKELLDGTADISLEDIGERPQVGLSVAATLARQHGIRLSLKEGPRGGALAIVLLPLGLFTAPPEQASQATSLEATRQHRIATAPAGDGTLGALVSGQTPEGLPRRHVSAPPDATAAGREAVSGPRVSPDQRQRALTAFTRLGADSGSRSSGLGTESTSLTEER